MKKKLTLLKTAFLLLFVLSCYDDNRDSRDNDVESMKRVKIEQLAKNLNADIRYDPNVTKQNSIVIKSKEEYERFIKRVQLQSRHKDVELSPKQILSTTQSKLCANGVYTGTGFDYGIVALEFDVTVSGGCISSISGGLVGFTLGNGYTQGATTFGCNGGTVCGTVDYNLFYEGIGTIYREKLCYNITLNC